MTSAIDTPYHRLYAVRPDGRGLTDPSGLLPDLILWPITPPGPGGGSRSALIRASMRSVWTVEPPEPPPGGPFIEGTTVPFNLDPLNPTSTNHNVGWDGNRSGGTYTALYTIPANTTVRNMVFNCDVIFTNATSGAENCLFAGGAPNASRGLMSMSNGGFFNFCTVMGRAASLAYYRNALRLTGGTATYSRNYFGRAVDLVHRSGTSRVVSRANCYGPMSFFDNDLDHGPGSEHGGPTYWTHNDVFQATSGDGVLVDDFFGDYFMGFNDGTGVDWTGDLWGVGTASGGLVGMPATTMNPPYSYFKTSQPNLSLWANAVTLSGTSKYRIRFEKCWWSGVSGPSGMFQITTSGVSGHEVWVYDNRFRMDGKGSGTNNKIRFMTFPSSTIVHVDAARPNIYDNHSSVPTALRGKPLTMTASGASYP